VFAYIARRIVYVIPIVISVALVCFLLVHITPGDPLVAVLPADASQELAAQLRTAYGFDRPLPVQFGLWMWRALHGDLGNSIATGRPVLSEVLRAVSNTVTLAIAAALIGFTLGLFFGLIAGYFRDTWIDKVATSIAIAGVSVPHYWLGMVMVIIFSVQLNWLPAVGAGPGGSGSWGWDWEHMKYLILPAITTSVIPMGIVTRTVRALTGDILSQDFVEALRAKGLRELDVFKHVIKNAAPTALAVMGLQLGYMLGGSILIETVFSWPGSGLLLNSAIFQRDLPLLQGTILVLALFYRASFYRSAHQTGLMMTVMSDTALQAAPATKARGYWATVGRRISRDKVSMVCAFVLVLIFLSALCAPWLGLADPYQGSMIRRLRHIGTPNYPLGTDELGRDMLARLIYGGRLSLIIGILPVILAFMIGTSLGLVAGYVGGKLNTAIMRTIDVFYAFPSVLLAIAISGALGAGIVNSIVSLTIVFVPQITRVAESVTTGVRNMDFVEAARASGAGPFTIMRVHMLGNVLGPIFVYATGLISVSMILAAGLSFLGLGTKPPEPEWGLMLNTLRTAIYVNPWVAALPGVMIFAVSICFNLLSDGMRSAMDIRN
jgi:ABC-type dipeptide/oligopeptide/nickel transport system permease subunit